MKIFCEVMVADILPSVRALVSRELTNSYNLSQSEISKKLGVTQPAVSQYKKELRGQKVKVLESNKEIMSEIKNFAKKVSKSELSSHESYNLFCRLCEKVRKENVMPKINKGINPKLVVCGK
ncbi:MAG: hypothetical protein V1944_01475 [Candidatus Aenigmatarchaeota archaeon]